MHIAHCDTAQPLTEYRVVRFPIPLLKLRRTKIEMAPHGDRRQNILPISLHLFSWKYPIHHGEPIHLDTTFHISHSCIKWKQWRRLESAGVMNNTLDASGSMGIVGSMKVLKSSCCPPIQVFGWMESIPEVHVLAWSQVALQEIRQQTYTSNCP